MESWTERIEDILDRAPTRAMCLSSLMRALMEEGATVDGRESWILQMVAERPADFKVIPDRLGPWVAWSGTRRPRKPQKAPGFGGDPWILACTSTSFPSGMDQRVIGRVRETLQAWGREIDEGSQMAVARWIGANKEAERALGRVLSLKAGRSQKQPSTTHPPRRPPRS